MIAPSTKDEFTALLIKGVVGYVDFAHGEENTARFPIDPPILGYNCVELGVIFIYSICTGILR